MPVEDRLLRFSAIPYPDESFVGYLLRLTERNHYDTLSWILQLAKIKDYAGASFSFARRSSIDLKPLVRLTGVDESNLRSMLYHPIRLSNERMMGQYSVFGSTVPHYLIRLREPKVCLDCIRESRYIRKIWELAPVTTCPVHRILLLDECPSCQKRITWNRAGISLCRCGFDWREHQAAVLDDSEIAVTRQIYLLCNLLHSSHVMDKSRSNNPLYGLGLGQFISALIFIASQLTGVAHRKGQRTIDTKGKTFAPSRTNAEIHTLLCKALPVFKDWPCNYYSFLDWRRTQKDTSDYARAHHSSFAEYKSALFVQLASPEFEFMRSAFREYRRIRRYESYIQSCSYLVNMSSRKEDESTFSTQRTGASLPGQTGVEISKLYETHMSGKKALKALNTTWSGLEGLIASGRLKAIVGNKGGNRLFLIEKESLEAVKEKLDRSVFLRQVEKLLGIQFERVKELIECGLLNPLRGPTIDMYGDWRFDPKEIESLLDHLFEGLITKPRHNEQKVSSFKLVLRRIGRVGINLGAFLHDVLAGEIKPCGKSKETGLRSLLFWERQITYYVQSELRLLIGDALSIPEISKLLGVTRTAVDFFVKKDLLGAEKFAGAQSLGLLVKQEELDSFNETYLLAREIASKHGTSPGYIINLLNTRGVKPVSGPKIDGGRVYIIKKRDVETLSLATLISEEKKKQTIQMRLPAPKVNSRSKGSKKISKSKSSCPLPKASQWWVLDESQAAEMLEMDINTVQQLAARGALKPHKRLLGDKYKDEEYYFSRYIVQKYKSRSINHIGLIAYTTAAKMCDLWPDNFYNRFVKTGRLNPVMADGRRGDYFFRVEDVEALLEIEKQTIITPEAAEILGVYISGVAKMIAAGVLKPISGPTIDGFGKNLFLRSAIDKLRAEREAYKVKRMNEGKTSRFGRDKCRQAA